MVTGQEGPASYRAALALSAFPRDGISFPDDARANAQAGTCSYRPDVIAAAKIPDKIKNRKGAPMSHYEKIPELLDNLLACSMAEAARRVGISPSLPWKWLVQSRLGKPELQEIEFCGVLAPFHVHYSQNIPALTAHQIQQTALERARDGVLVDVFFQGQRMFERVLKEEYAHIKEDELWIEVGPDWEKVCYETRPTKQWLKPSDALVIKMLESWNRKRYGAHQQIDVNYGGVLRLEKETTATPKAIEHKPAEVFEDAPEDEFEQRGGHLALAAAASSSQEFEERARSGEFDQAEVTFRDADGKPTALRPDIEELRRQAAELKKNGPVHRQPSHRVEIFKPDEKGKAVVAEDEEPEPQTAADHPRAYYVDKLSPPRRPPTYSKEERCVGTGREGIGVGPDPSKIGPHIGFRIPQR